MILGIFTSLSNPTKKSTTPFLINNSNIDLTLANNLFVSVEVIAMIIGLGLGTLLSFYFSPFSLLIFDAIFFFVGIILLLFIKLRFKAKTTIDYQLIEKNKSTIKYIISNNSIHNILLFLVLPFYFSAGLFYAGATIWASNYQDFYGRELSLFFLFLAIGAMLSFLIVKKFYKINQYKIISTSFALAGIFILSAILLEKTIFIYPLLVLLGLFIGCLYNLSVVLFHKTVKPNILGRVLSINEILFGVMFILGIFTLKIFQLDSLTWNWIYSSVVLILTSILIIIFKLRLVINETELDERTTRYLQKQN